MKKMLFISVVLTLLLQGCATPQFIINNQIEIVSSNISIIDVRDEYSKNGGKRSITDTFLYREDASIIPSKRTLLINVLQSVYGKDAKLNVTLTKFDVLDHYPNRMGAAQSAALASLSPALAASGGISGSDFISCEIEVKINNVTYTSVHAAPYKISATALWVPDEEPYKIAVKGAVSKALDKLKLQLTK